MRIQSESCESTAPSKHCRPGGSASVRGILTIGQKSGLQTAGMRVKVWNIYSPRQEFATVANAVSWKSSPQSAAHTFLDEWNERECVFVLSFSSLKGRCEKGMLRPRSGDVISNRHTQREAVISLISSL